MGVPSGQHAPSLLPLASPRPPFTAGCRPSRCSRTGRSTTAARKPYGYKLSTDPFFVEKVRDIVGPYLNPPDKAMVLCVDEKTQIQALDRTQPLLPMGLGYVEGGHARLHPPWHHHPVRCPGRGHGGGADPVQASPQAPGVPRLPPPDREVRPGGSRRPPDRRQLLHPQARQSSCLAGPTAPLPRPRHTHLRLLAQPGGALLPLRGPSATGSSPSVRSDRAASPAS